MELVHDHNIEPCWIELVDHSVKGLNGSDHVVPITRRFRKCPRRRSASRASRISTWNGFGSTWMLRRYGRGTTPGWFSASNAACRRSPSTRGGEGSKLGLV